MVHIAFHTVRVGVEQLRAFASDVRRFADQATALARETGAACVAVRNCSHCGALAPYGLRLADYGMVSFIFTHVDSMVLPYSAIEPFCGTNPLCFTAPGANGKTLDMATSIVPWSTIANAQREAVSIPTGWAVDEAGRDTTDPSAVTALHPFGEHNCSGLGLMIDVLCAMFSGTPFGPRHLEDAWRSSSAAPTGRPSRAINISAFTSVEAFGKRIAELVSKLGQLKPAANSSRVLFSCRPELETKAVREVEGIAVGVQIFAELMPFRPK